MNVIDWSHPARSIAPSARASWIGPVQVAMVASRSGRLRLPVVRQLGDGLDRGIEPDRRVRLDLDHRLERGRHERGDRVVLLVERLRARDEPGPRQRRDRVDLEDRDLLAVQLELDRLVVGEPGRGIDRAQLDGGRLGEVGVLDDLDVVGRQPGRLEQRLEHDPARAVAAGDADLLALQVRRGADPGRRLGEDDVRELAVDRRDVGDRDAVADRRDDARPVADPDVDRALADERDEVRVDLVLELDVEAGIGVVAVLLRRGRTGRTGRSGCSRARRPASSG